MKYKLVIFDFDGTLADSFPWLTSVVNEVADRYKFKPLDLAAIEQLRGVDAASAIAQTGVPAWKVPLIGNHVRKMMARDIHTIPLFDGVEAMLQDLAGAGIQLGILSSNSLPNIQRVLGPRNAALVSYYECGASIFGKQAKLRKLLKRSGVAPAEVLCVGDEIRDIVAARGEQVPFGAVTWGYSRAEALQAHNPAEVFWSVEDMTKRLVA
jgi:phosphoglycolate phosphatase